MQGSIGHTTCEYQQLLDQTPDIIIPARPLTVRNRVYDAGDPLGGNICPFNSSTPLQPCKKVQAYYINSSLLGVVSYLVHMLAVSWTPPI